MNTTPLERQLEARQRALGALDTIARLAAFPTLTERQKSDAYAARADWNEARDAIPALPAFGDADWSSDDVDRAERALRSIGASMDASRVVVANRATLQPSYERANPMNTTTTRDELRDMISAGERFHEFETRALVTTGDTVPVEFRDLVAVYQRQASPWLGLATIVNSSNGQSVTLPQLTTDVTSYVPGEGTAITPSDPTFDSALLTVASYKTLTYISAELFEDAGFSVSDYVARSAGRSTGLAAGSSWTATVLAGISNGGTATGTPFFGLDDVIDLQSSVAVPYRDSSTFVMSNDAAKKLRKLKATDGSYLWQPSTAAGQPASLFGNAAITDPYLAAPGSATKAIAFGDWRSALVIKQLPLRVEISRDFRMANDEIAIKVVYRAGLAVVDPVAAAYLVSGNA